MIAWCENAAVVFPAAWFDFVFDGDGHLEMTFLIFGV